MHILRATIIKDSKILLRDRVGLFMMFFMPILLADTDMLDRIAKAARIHQGNR